jgi:hypothetical protein
MWLAIMTSKRVFGDSGNKRGSYIGNANGSGGLRCRHDGCAGRVGISQGVKVGRKRRETPQVWTGLE